MSIELLTILLVILMMIFFAAGLPVGFVLGGIAMLLAVLTWGPQAFKSIPISALNAVNGFVILAVPLFIFLGQILLHSGLGEAMFHAVHILSGRLRGGLAIGVIIVTSMMAAMVGIIGAGILTAGTIALPHMLKRNYNRYLALGCVMAGGGMGILIPPSIPMVLFASVTQTSIGRMFAGGMIPGLIMSSLFIVYIAIRAYLQPNWAPALPKEELQGGLKDKLIALRDSIFAFGLIVLILGSIMAGAATPTEAAAVGGVGAILIAMFYRRFSMSVLKDASIYTMKLTGMCVWIMVGATIFSNFHMLMGAGRLLTRTFLEAGLSPMGVIAMMQGTMLIMGCFIDEFIIVLICAPLYTPIAVSLGFDPIWFGVLMIINMEIAIQTPPYGFALFYLKACAPEDVKMLDIYKSVAPFLAIKFIVMALVMAFPKIITFLPDLIFG
jgi:tripartite ATP-independent transporter DctM subunit